MASAANANSNTATAIISSVCNKDMALMIRNPSPCFDANISARSTPSSVTVKPMRNPDTTSGRLAGNRMVLIVCHCESFMLRADFTRGIRKLAQFNLTYDILIFPRQLPAAIKLVKRFPDQPFVLDHIAKPQIKDRVISPWREQLRELAKAPNVLCKLSGMVTEANWNGWTDADFEPYLDPVFEAFGASRLMFGSDWPVCLLAGSYERVFGIVQNRIALLPATQKESILGGNAEEFYLEGRRSLS